MRGNCSLQCSCPETHLHTKLLPVFWKTLKHTQECTSVKTFLPLFWFKRMSIFFFLKTTSFCKPSDIISGNVLKTIWNLLHSSTRLPSWSLQSLLSLFSWLWVSTGVVHTISMEIYFRQHMKFERYCFITPKSCFFPQVARANFALNFLLSYLSASLADPVPEEPSDIQQRFTGFKSWVAQVKDVLDRTIAASPDVDQLQTP